MARRNSATARERLERDPFRLVCQAPIAILTLLLSVSGWVSESPGWGTGCLLVGLVVMLSFGPEGLIRFLPGGMHWRDKWQAGQGNQMDLVLSGQTFKAQPLEGLRGPVRMLKWTGGPGLSSITSGAQMVSNPFLGALAAPLVMIGGGLIAAGAAADAAVSVTGALRERMRTPDERARREAERVQLEAEQARRDAEETRRIRVEARLKLEGEIRALESRREATRGLRARSQLRRALGYCREAISRIDALP